jgi:hypothetical protein
MSLWALIGVILIAAVLFLGTFSLTSSEFRALPVVIAVPYEWGGPFGVFFATLGAGLILIGLGIFIDFLAIRRRKLAGGPSAQGTGSKSPFIQLESSKYLGKVFTPPPEPIEIEQEVETHPELESQGDAIASTAMDPDAENEPYAEPDHGELEGAQPPAGQGWDHCHITSNSRP